MVLVTSLVYVTTAVNCDGVIVNGVSLINIPVKYGTILHKLSALYGGMEGICVTILEEW